jgi:hypothetical protein
MFLYLFYRNSHKLYMIPANKINKLIDLYIYFIVKLPNIDKFNTDKS